MSTTNTIVLRPRFKIQLNHANESVLLDFEKSKSTQKDFIVNRIDDHVFIKFPKHKQHFWSPQLHLEINEETEDTATLHGLFGPNPTVWSLFMFLHFFVAVVFIGFGAWAYSNWSLKNTYGMQVSVMILMIIIWFALYFAGRMGRLKGKDEMHELHEFMNKVLKKCSKT
jgi:hypothetical protein